MKPGVKIGLAANRAGSYKPAAKIQKPSVKAVGSTFFQPRRRSAEIVMPQPIAFVYRIVKSSFSLRHRRTTLAIAASLCCVGAALLADQPVTPSQVGTGQQGRQVSLEDQLRIGLKAFTQSDLDFIDLVVLRVQQGKLPRSLVDSTFLWARTRYLRRPGSFRLRPMVYFRPALTLRASRIGVPL